MEHIIKKCAMEDLKTLKEISCMTYDETFRHMNTAENMKAYLEKAFDLNKLKEELSNNASSFYLLYVDNKLAGYIKTNDTQAQTDVNDPESLELERIYVLKKFQGFGLGGVLIKKAISEAEALGKKYIWLGVWEKNNKAIEFYKRNGFYITGSHPFFMGDDEQIDLIMRRDLNNPAPMTVERSENGQITIRDGNNVSAVSPMVTTSDEQNNSRFTEWAESCAKLVKTNSHTISETEQFFLTLCDVIPLEPASIHIENFKFNIVLSYFKDKLEHQPPKFSFDMTDKEIENWHREDRAMREEILNSPPERFGLVMHGYHLPHSHRNEEIYENTKRLCEKYQTMHAKELLEKYPPAPPIEVKNLDIYFLFEESTGYLQCCGGGQDIYQKLILFKGITQDDIDKSSPQFLSYITVLRDTGMLPEIQENY